MLSLVSGVHVVQMAAILETAPVGGPPQGLYLNTVVEVETTRSPRDLLTISQGIERRLGRLPAQERWSPRPIDLDLLLYGDTVINEQDFIVPHPRLHERLFVLEPLMEINPDFIHPILKKSANEIYSMAEKSKIVRKIR
jgi:2-amino-4-hydroxy-6-hydroxymethyldihydropteridine diphosphokinase